METGFAAAPATAGAPPRRQEETELGILDTVGSVVLVKRDMALFYEGDVADCYFKVVSGTVRNCKLLSDGRRHIADFSLAGDFVGFHTLDTHGCSAEAVTDASLVRYERRVIDALVSRNPSVGMRLLARACAELCEARTRMLLLSRMSAQERLASFLMRMATRRSRDITDTIALPMTRNDIGDHLGLTTETVCRTLAQLKSAGLIEAFGPHELRLLRPQALAALAQGG